MSSSEDEILVKKNKKVILDSDDENIMNPEIVEKSDDISKLESKIDEEDTEKKPENNEQKIEQPQSPELTKQVITEMNSSSKKIKKPGSPFKNHQGPKGSSADKNANWKNKSNGKNKPEKENLKAKSSNSKPNSKSTTKKESSSKRKEIIAVEVLKRWWYALPHWPPANYDYSTVLSANKLREVNPDAWTKEPNTDSKGNLKVQQVQGYPGCYRDSQGAFYDLRPKENCPSFENMINKPMEELLEILLKALENQLKELKSSDYMNEKLADKLSKMIVRTNELVETKKEEA